MIKNSELAAVLPAYLREQRWYGSSDRTLTGVRVVDMEVWKADFPGLAWVLAEATFADAAPATYQIFVGLRPLGSTQDFLRGKDNSVIGELPTPIGRALAYDALIDPHLTLEVARRLAPDETFTSVRPLNVEQSNTSIVFDERLILKVFRRVYEGANPDVDVTRRLHDVGFENITAPVVEWRRHGFDLAVLRVYLVGSTAGLAMARLSLRDIFQRRRSPGTIGGDFGPEARRLGEITARLHLAMAEAYGLFESDPAGWAAAMAAHLDRIDATGIDRDAVLAQYRELAELDDAGPAMRIHGDYHLDQTLRTDDGWYVLDFEGEPARPLDERIAPSSPLRDVAGMMRSFQYAARLTLAERGEHDEAELLQWAEQWEQHVVRTFIAGYRDTPGIDALLPPKEEALWIVLRAFELDKAVYEVGYERAHRPTWVDIPLSAVNRLIEIRA